MACSDSYVLTAFSFAVISDIYVFLLVLLSALVLLNKLSSNILSISLFLSAPLLLIFGIVQILALGSECRDGFVDIQEIRGERQIAYALQMGSRAIVLGAFMSIIVLINRFMFGGDWMMRTRNKNGNKIENMKTNEDVTT